MVRRFNAAVCVLPFERCEFSFHRQTMPTECPIESRGPRRDPLSKSKYPLEYRLRQSRTLGWHFIQYANIITSIFASAYLQFLLHSFAFTLFNLSAFLADDFKHREIGSGGERERRRERAREGDRERARRTRTNAFMLACLRYRLIVPRM